MNKLFDHFSADEGKFYFSKELTQGTLLKRPNRFVAYVRLPSGEEIKAHVPVGGRIGGLVLDGLPCLISGPYEKRATTHTVEAIGIPASETTAFQWVGIHQSDSNHYVDSCFKEGLLQDLLPSTGTKWQSEKPLGKRRIDFYAEPAQGKPCWLEVKTPLIKLHMEIPAAIPVKTYSSDAIGARMPGQMVELFKRLDKGERVVLLASFIYENTLKTNDELKLRDNLNLDGLLDEGKRKGLESWQITFSIDPQGVSLKKYVRLL